MTCNIGTGRGRVAVDGHQAKICSLFGYGVLVSCLITSRDVPNSDYSHKITAGLWALQRKSGAVVVKQNLIIHTLASCDSIFNLLHWSI